MLLNTSKNKKLKNKKKTFEARFYWARFSILTLSKMLVLILHKMEIN